MGQYSNERGLQMSTKKWAALLAAFTLAGGSLYTASAAGYTPSITSDTNWVTDTTNTKDTVVSSTVSDEVTVTNGAKLTIKDPVNLAGSLTIGDGASSKGNVQAQDNNNQNDTTIRNLWLKDYANASGGTHNGNVFYGNNVTITGNQLAVDAGGDFRIGLAGLPGGTIDVAKDGFTIEGGQAIVSNATVTSGVWVSSIKLNDNLVYGAAQFTNTTFEGGNLAVQGSGAGLMLNGSTANVENIAVWDKVLVGLDAGSIGELYDQTLPDDYSNRYSGAAGASQLTIYNGSNVTAQNLYLRGVSSLVVGNAMGTNDTSSLTITGNAIIDGASTLSVYDGSTFTLGSGAVLTVQGSGMTGTLPDGTEVTVYPGISVASGGTASFEAGSKTYTTADDNGKVQSVLFVEDGGTVKVDAEAGLYVSNAVTGQSYDLSDVIASENDSPISWTGQVFGKNQLIQLSADGTFEARSFADSFSGLFASSIMEAAYNDPYSTAYQFVEDVITNRYQSTNAAADNAKITEALNSAAGLTGLAGVGYGLVSFTDDLARSIDSHTADESGLWASYLHDKRSADGLAVGNLDADYDITFDGAVVGVDFAKTETARYGAAISYAAGETSASGLASTENKADYYGGALYGVWTGASGLTYKAELGYTKSENDITQWNSGTKITADADADAFYAGVRAEKAYALQNGTLTPYVGVRYTDLSVDSYTDSLGFAHDSDSAGLWNLPFGVVYRRESTSASGWTFAPEVELGYQLAFGDKDFDETVSYGKGADTFGIDMGENSFIGRLSLTAAKDDLAFGIHYGYQKGSDTQSQAWGLTASLKF